MPPEESPSSPYVATVSLTCPKCGAVGAAVWEIEKWGPSLASLSGNFYERLAKFSPYKIEIVCHACGAPAVQSSDRKHQFISSRERHG